MDKEASINVVEKKRLRQSIENEVQRFLDQGGEITVVEAPARAPARAVSNGSWDGAIDIGPTLD